MSTRKELALSTLIAAALAGGVWLFGAVGAMADPQGEMRIAVIDEQRIFTESRVGREALDRLQRLQDEKLAEGQARQQEIERLRRRVAEGRLTLSEDRLSELQAELEEKLVAFRRYQDDVERQLERERTQTLSRIERQVMPIIERVGREQGINLIFNKFGSGLVYADEGVDITDLVIERVNDMPGGGR